MKMKVVVQFSSVSSVTQSIVFAHSFRQTNFFTLYGDRDARSLLSDPLLYHSMGQIIKSRFLSVYVCVCLWARIRSHFSTDLHEIW